MAWVIYVYWVISLTLVVSAFVNAGWGPALSTAGTSLLSFFAGAGLRGSLYGTKGQKLAGLGMAVVFMGIAHWVGHGFSAHVFGYDFDGTQWGWLGFVVCFLCTTKRFAV
jgi:hypothetical protein